MNRFTAFTSEELEVLQAIILARFFEQDGAVIARLLEEVSEAAEQKYQSGL